MSEEPSRTEILQAEVVKLTEIISKIEEALVVTSADLKATKLIKESLEDTIKGLPEQKEIIMPFDGVVQPE